MQRWDILNTLIGYYDYKNYLTWDYFSKNRNELMNVVPATSIKL